MSSETTSPISRNRSFLFSMLAFSDFLISILILSHDPQTLEHTGLILRRAVPDQCADDGAGADKAAHHDQRRHKYQGGMPDEIQENQRNKQHIPKLYLTCFHTTFHALRNPASTGLIFVMSSGRQDFLILNF